jgi:hypothetical protein
MTTMLVVLALWAGIAALFLRWIHVTKWNEPAPRRAPRRATQLEPPTGRPSLDRETQAPPIDYCLERPIKVRLTICDHEGTRVVELALRSVYASQRSYPYHRAVPPTTSARRRE